MADPPNQVATTQQPDPAGIDLAGSSVKAKAQSREWRFVSEHSTLVVSAAVFAIFLLQVHSIGGSPETTFAVLRYMSVSTMVLATVDTLLGPILTGVAFVVMRVAERYPPWVRAAYVSPVFLYSAYTVGRFWTVLIGVLMVVEVVPDNWSASGRFTHIFNWLLITAAVLVIARAPTSLPVEHIEYEIPNRSIAESHGPPAVGGANQFYVIDSDDGGYVVAVFTNGKLMFIPVDDILVRRPCDISDVPWWSTPFITRTQPHYSC